MVVREFHSKANRGDAEKIDPRNSNSSANERKFCSSPRLGRRKLVPTQASATGSFGCGGGQAPPMQSLPVSPLRWDGPGPICRGRSATAIPRQRCRQNRSAHEAKRVEQFEAHLVRRQRCPLGKSNREYPSHSWPREPTAHRPRLPQRQVMLRHCRGIYH
jgi:hypothetical protein